MVLLFLPLLLRPSDEDDSMFILFLGTRFRLSREDMAYLSILSFELYRLVDMPLMDGISDDVCGDVFMDGVEDPIVCAYAIVGDS